MERGTHFGRVRETLHDEVAHVVDWLSTVSANALASRAPLPGHGRWLPAAAGADEDATLGIVSLPGEVTAVLCARQRGHGGSNCAAEIVRRAMLSSGVHPLTPHVLTPFATLDSVPDVHGAPDSTEDVITATGLPFVPRCVLLAARPDSSLAAHAAPADIALSLLHATFQLHHAAIALTARFPMGAWRSLEATIEVFGVADAPSFVYRAMLPDVSTGVLEPHEATTPAHTGNSAMFASFVHWDGFQPYSSVRSSVTALLAGAVRVLLHRALIHAALAASHSSDVLLLRGVVRDTGAQAALLLNTPGGTARAVATLASSGGAATLPPAAAHLAALCTALDATVAWEAPVTPGKLVTRCAAVGSAQAADVAARNLLRTAYDPWVVTWTRAEGGVHGGAYDADGWRVPFGGHDELEARTAATHAAFEDGAAAWVVPDARLAAPTIHYADKHAAAAAARALRVLRPRDPLVIGGDIVN